MGKAAFFQKDFTKRVLTWMLIVLCAVFMGLKLKLDGITRKKIPGSSIIYIPSGKFLKYITFGYSSFAADLIYLWAIQYYGTYEIADRFKYLDHIFSIIAELDPRYVDPYETGAMIAIYEAQDPQLSYKILDRGLEKNPDQWIFPFDAGHYAQMVAKDYETAEKYFKKAMEIPGAPEHVKRLYANALYKQSDLKSAWETWLEIYNTAKDDRIRKIANNHLYQVKSTADTKALAEAVGKFKERTNRLPQNLEELRRAGFIAAVPKDLDNKDYLYNPTTGEVKAPSLPWKR
jgi:tetratricopeptide (TPR) repeat protein